MSPAQSVITDASRVEHYTEGLVAASDERLTGHVADAFHRSAIRQGRSIPSGVLSASSGGVFHRWPPAFGSASDPPGQKLHDLEIGFLVEGLQSGGSRPSAGNMVCLLLEAL